MRGDNAASLQLFTRHFKLRSASMITMRKTIICLRLSIIISSIITI